MPAGRFSTSNVRRPSRFRKLFTLDEANRSLPLVRKIVADIVSSHARAAKLHEQIEASSRRQAALLQDKLDHELDVLHDLVAELTQVGAEVKDYGSGLIDFPARHQDRFVYLCWRLGEERVEHWHELDAGFSGRRPASMLAD